MILGCSPEIESTVPSDEGGSVSGLPISGPCQQCVGVAWQPAVAWGMSRGVGGE